MTYDKPKVTIDLDEYLELKKKLAMSDSADLNLGDQVAILDGYGVGSQQQSVFKVTNIDRANSGIVNYTLSGIRTITLSIKRNS